MHFSLKTLTLLGSVALTPALGDEMSDLGYLKCVSAVVKTTSFPTCTSSYKLDCFCEASARLNQSKSILVEALPSGSAWSASGSDSESGTEARTQASARARVQLAPEVEEVCVENGVPKDEIDRYLCDDSAVSASPRRGSTPINRVGTVPQGQMKRAISPDETRLLIPENGDAAQNAPAPAPAPAGQNDNEQGEERQATPDDLYEVVTVTSTRTHTKTECSCEKTAEAEVHEPASSEAEASPAPTSSSPSSPAAEDEDSDDESTMTGAMHGTQIAVAILPTPSSASEFGSGSGMESESVRVASSSVAPVPTGVDATKDHGVNQDGDDMFEGKAGVVGVERGVVVGVLGLVGAVLVL